VVKACGARNWFDALLGWTPPEGTAQKAANVGNRIDKLGNRFDMALAGGGKATASPDVAMGLASAIRPPLSAGEPQWAMKTGTSACNRMWLVAPPKIICRKRLCV
jgi:hypothetical protein